MAASTFAKKGSIASGSRSVNPSSKRHRRSTSAGVRRHVPEFTVVDPPTVEPVGMAMNVLPTSPRCRCIASPRSHARPRKSLRVKCPPSSRITTA